MPRPTAKRRRASVAPAPQAPIADHTQHWPKWVDDPFAEIDFDAFCDTCGNKQHSLFIQFTMADLLRTMTGQSEMLPNVNGVPCDGEGRECPVCDQFMPPDDDIADLDKGGVR